MRVVVTKKRQPKDSGGKILANELSIFTCVPNCFFVFGEAFEHCWEVLVGISWMGVCFNEALGVHLWNN